MKILNFIILSLSFTTAAYTQDVLILSGNCSKKQPNRIQKFTEYQAALQKVPQVGSLPDPELNLGVFLSPMELVSGKQVADIRLMQMFPWFGVLRNCQRRNEPDGQCQI